MIQTDKKVRFVFIEMPILGPTSLTAALWAHAAHKQGKYFEFHTILMEHNGAIEDSVLEAAAKRGPGPEKAKKDVQSEEIGQEVDKGMLVGREIGIQGTPGFVINGQLFPGLSRQGRPEASHHRRPRRQEELNSFFEIKRIDLRSHDCLASVLRRAFHFRRAAYAV